jgi:hypothetical protein
MLYKILIVVILLYLLTINDKNEKFQSEADIKKKSNELFKFKNMFKPSTSYSSVKKKISWIDPVIYDNVYKLSLREKLTISNLENSFYT